MPTNVGLMIGRFQPFHAGHQALCAQVLTRHPKVLIGIRNVGMDKNNPWTPEEVARHITATLVHAGYRGDQFDTLILPNIGGVYYGRDVGYHVEEIVLPPEIQAISASAIRAATSARSTDE